MRPCQICQTPLKRQQAKFCSQKCQGIGKRVDQTFTKECLLCETTYDRTTCRTMKNWKNRKYCSTRCRDLAKRKEPEAEMYCWWCDEYIERGLAPFDTYKCRKFCSREHYYLFAAQPNSRKRIQSAAHNRPNRWLSAHQRAMVLALRHRKSLDLSELKGLQWKTFRSLLNLQLVSLINCVIALTQTGIEYNIFGSTNVAQLCFLNYGVIPRKKVVDI